MSSAAGAYTFVISMVAWAHDQGGDGVCASSPEEEIEGLDIGEHGNAAYPDFQLATVGSGLVSSGDIGRSGGSLAMASQMHAETSKL